jgi:NTP pyrophosphatase (non-canonical NTP hydrolase)
MKIDKYQKWVVKSAYYKPEGLWYPVLGMIGESGELMEAIPSPAAVLDETGDVFWYVAYTAHMIGVKLSEVAGTNEFGHMMRNWDRNLSRHVAAVAEQVKKLYRNDGGEMSESRRDTITAYLSATVTVLGTISNDFGHMMEDVAKHNMDKLGKKKGIVG